MENRLVEIAPNDWPQLRDLYIEQKSLSSAYNFFEIAIDWIKQNVDIKIYALNGEWHNDGTFISKLGEFIVCNTLSDNHERLLRALNCLDRGQEYFILGYQERVTDAIEKHFLHCQLEPEQFKPDCTVWVTIERTKALCFNIEPPEGFCLKRVTVDNADQINSVWPHRGPNSLKYLQMLIIYNDSVGVFNTSGHLVAWCLIAPLGCLSVLQVAEEYRRQGFGQLVVRYMSRLIANKGLEVNAPIVHTNQASRSMFEKLGFRIIDRAYFVQRPAIKGNPLPSS